eukprot:6172075-Pleurochrysis_carterae.AAC.5
MASRRCCLFVPRSLKLASMPPNPAVRIALEAAGLARLCGNPHADRKTRSRMARVGSEKYLCGSQKLVTITHTSRKLPS